MVTVAHDNGVKGQVGFTEYSSAEIDAIGGIDALRNDYEIHGIVIHDIVID